MQVKCTPQTVERLIQKGKPSERPNDRAWTRHRPVIPTGRQPATIPTQRCGAVGSLDIYAEEGVTDRTARGGKHTIGHNSVAAFDLPRESVLENKGNAQPEYPLRGILALYCGEDANTGAPIVSNLSLERRIRWPLCWRFQHQSR